MYNNIYIYIIYTYICYIVTFVMYYGRHGTTLTARLDTGWISFPAHSCVVRQNPNQKQVPFLDIDCYQFRVMVPFGTVTQTQT